MELSELIANSLDDSPDKLVPVSLAKSEIDEITSNTFVSELSGIKYTILEDGTKVEL